MGLRKCTGTGASIVLDTDTEPDEGWCGSIGKDELRLTSWKNQLVLRDIAARDFGAGSSEDR